jgi:predicted anti-sigma-YlaC factor YlaD
MTANSQSCERARWWASLRADGELSALESAMLRAHLAGCLPCRSFASCADDVAAALRGARLEPPPLLPLALVPPRRRPALRALQIVVAAALVAAAGSAAALVGVDRSGGTSSVAKRVAVVASGESPDALRELRRQLLLAPPPRELPRNRHLPPEAI